MSFKGLLTGVTGLRAQAKKMEVIGNNLSNVNTAGFKEDRVTFRDTLYDSLRSGTAAGSSIGGVNPMQIGNGVEINSIDTLHTQGVRQSSARTLDFMIDGDDFFIVKNGTTSELVLTRNGNFQIDGNGNLVDAIGNKVYGFNANLSTGAVSSTAATISLPTTAISPNATSSVSVTGNLDMNVMERLATGATNGWELFSGGENFGKMSVAVRGASSAGTVGVYGSGYYGDSKVYQDTAATLDATNTLVTLAASPTNLVQGFTVGDKVSVRQGTTVLERKITAINTATRVLTLESAVSSLSAGTVAVVNLSNGTDLRGTSGSTIVHNDVLRSQISMVTASGALIGTFYRVDGDPLAYSRSLADVSGGGTVKVGVGEFTNMRELKELMERTLRDTELTYYSSSTGMDVSIDKYDTMTFTGTGLVNTFRVVINSDNTEMLDYFQSIAITDAASAATTQARVDSSGDVAAAPGIGANGARSVNATKAWYAASGLQSLDYSSTAAATGYGEFAGLRLDGGTTGLGFGTIKLQLTNALNNSVSAEFKLVARDADPGSNEFTNLEELAALMQETLRSSNFSSIVSSAGALQADSTALVSFEDGRLNVSTSAGVFRSLTVSAVNTTENSVATRTDSENLSEVLGALADGVNGKSAKSNKFIQADSMTQTKVYDSLGNEHTSVSYYVLDRSAGLSNIEWKYRTLLNPNANTYSTESPSNKAVYRNTFNSIVDSSTTRGVIAFNSTTGAHISSSTAGVDSRYRSTGTLSFTSQTSSATAAQSTITFDFSDLTSFNGLNTVEGFDENGYPMGNLIRLDSEENTGSINGVYSNGQIRLLAKLGLMSVSNSGGLAKIGNSYYRQTTNSDASGTIKGSDKIYAVGATAGSSNDQVTSRINGKALEASNVDLTLSLTDMIVTQRSYSASGKTITTSDEMLQEALNLKR